MTGTPLPAAGFFTGAITNSQAKAAQNDQLAFTRQSMLGGNLEASPLTIASGSITPTMAVHTIETEAAASADDLTNAALTNMIEGQLLLLSCTNSAHVVTVKHAAGGSGQFTLYGGADAVLNSTSKHILFKLIGTSWIEVMRNFDTKFIDGGTVGGTANSITLAPVVPIPAYAAKQVTVFTPTANNTGAVQVNTSGRGAIDLKKVKGKTLVDLEADDLIANVPVIITHDGTRQILFTPQMESKDAHGVGIINGNFDIWQRGTSFAITGGSYQYTADRWKATLGTGSGWTVSRNAVTGVTNRYSLKAQRNAAATTTTNFVLQNVFESKDSIAYSGEKLTILLKLKKGANFSPTAIGIAVISGTGTDEGDPNVFTGGTNVISTTIAAASISTSETLFVLTSAAVVPTTCNQLGVQITATGVGTAGADDSFEVSTVYLKRGVTNTVPLSRAISDEERLCQRYARKYTDIYIGTTQTNTLTYQNGIVYFATTMRAAPTLTAGSSFTAASGSNGTPALGGYTTADAVQLFNSAANWTVNTTVAFTGILSAEL